MVKMRTAWAFILSCMLVAGVAVAQQQKVEIVRTKKPASSTADDVAKTARDVSNGQQSQEKGFLEAQSIRAAEIARKARDDKAGIQALQQVEKVEAESKKHESWARDQFERAQGIATGTIDAADADFNGGKEKPPRPKYLVFVSQSMGNAALKAAFDIGRGNPDVLYVFRGFLPNQTPLQFQAAMVKFQKKSEDQIVQIGLDPPSFTNFNINSVPAIAVLDAQEKLVAKVSGLANFKWLKEKVEDGQKGDLGNRGNTYAIAEPNLIDQMKAKAAAVDYKKLAEEAKSRFFREMPTIDLPYATDQRVRKVFPVLEVKSDIRDKDGVVQHRAGERIDMKAQLVTAPMLVIFNSQDKYHVEFAKEMAKRAPPNRKVIFMTTRVDRDAGISGYASQEYAIGRPVFLLMQDVKSTFGIERVPTVVTPTENEFLVVEVPLTQGASGNAGTHTP